LCRGNQQEFARAVRFEFYVLVLCPSELVDVLLWDHEFGFYVGLVADSAADSGLE